ncbi:DUF4270 family protein [Parapedobacter sp. 10938]|uniref:DUF4270 family protein n=1 Tax=Parapedobacter flavus TaxID=3110225 RepID=UPI002DBFBCDB|nr:DUF4270 family protein [Parapedobacter sp. 10938]MEC3880504.1 DUF4270 family protein [Parapedobacter sp. 10938]
MRYHTKDLLTLLISLFVLGGCTNPSGIGLDVDPGDELVGVLTDTLTLEAVTVPDDSTRSSSFAQTTFGWLDDPVIGKTVADLALAIGRPTTVPRIRTDAEIDSVILVLPYGTEYFGDTLRPNFTLEVLQLDEAYTDGEYATKQWAVTDEVIGTKTIGRFAYKETDSVKIITHVDDRDTSLMDIPQLRISLSPAFFRELLSEEVDSAMLSTEAGFNNHVKGLYLRVAESEMTGVGGLVSFQGLANKTGIELTYRQPNGEEGEDAAIDTLRAFLPTTIQGNGGTFRRLTSSIRRTYTADVQAQLDHPEAHYDVLYLQAPAGLRTRVHIPYIDELKDRNIAINKVELVLYASTDIPGDALGLQAPRLTLYREDIAGQRQPIPDGDSRTSGGGFAGDSRSLWYRYGNWRAFGGLLDEEKDRYIFHLTSYIQDILQGKISSSEFFIAPAATSDNSVPYFPVLNAGGRTIINNVEDTELKMKLNIYYTKRSVD